MVRLAFGVVAGRDLGVWASGPDGVAMDARRVDLGPGIPVVVGPRGLNEDVVAEAIDGFSAAAAPPTSEPTRIPSAWLGPRGWPSLWARADNRRG